MRAQIKTFFIVMFFIVMFYMKDTVKFLLRWKTFSFGTVPQKKIEQK